MGQTVKEKLAALSEMPLPKLKVVWREYFKDDPVRFQKDYMVRRIAYHIQVNAYGGLSKSALNKLRQLAGEPASPKLKLTPGTRLIKVHKGKRIHVLVLEEGYEFRGKRYQSLTAISSELMGCRMSGPRFFGLRDSDEK